MFTINPVGGFSLTFDNGITVSVQFHDGSYASGRGITESGLSKASLAEVAVFTDTHGSHSRWIPLRAGEDVRGWVNANDVARIIAAASAIKNPAVADLRYLFDDDLPSADESDPDFQDRDGEVD